MNRPFAAWIALMLACSLPSAVSPAQPASTIPLSSPLPLDTSIVSGRLANGLSYFIRLNHKPEKRAELRLVVNAGSILEDKDQQGLAHFVEHMAFNGTKNFAKNDLINYLESVGVRFGADLNAYTSFDETVYMLQVPTDTPSILNKAFEILGDWAHLVSFDDTEIDKERGVILEEWRLGRGADARLRDKEFPVIFDGSRYAERLPIGKPDIIRNVDHNTLRRFYNDWYRPDLMAVVAVGDFDKSKIEHLIKQNFSGIPNRTAERVRPLYPVPDHKATLYAIATDKEATLTSVDVYYLQPIESDTLVRDYRRSLVEALFNQMLNERFQEIARQADPPFLYAYGGGGSFVRTKNAFTLGAGVKDGGVARGLQAIITEASRVLKYGFTQTELDRTKSDLLRGIETAYNERTKTESGRLADELIRHFLSDEPVPGISYEYDLYKRFLPEITLSEVNALAPEWIERQNRVVTISAPEKSAATIPDTTALARILNDVDHAEVAPYQDVVTSEPLLKTVPTPGSVVSRSERQDIGVTELTLSNGVKVYLKPTEFKNDEVLFGAFSNGGSSLVADSDYLAAATACGLLQESGLGSFDKTALEKKLAGTVAQVSPYISELSQGLGGSASPKDLTTLFRLVYLYFTSPRADSTAFLSYLARTRAYLENRNARPEAAFDDTMQVTMSQHNFRRRPFSLSMLQELNLQKSLAIYKDRFANASEFTFVFVGNFTVASMESLLTTYVASLPSTFRQETWHDLGIRPPSGKVQKDVHRGIEQKSQVRIVFTGPFEWTREHRFALDALAQVLTIKLRQNLREDKGGTYGVRVSGVPIRIPEQRYQFSISFGCAPNRVQELTRATFDAIDSLQRFPADAPTVEKVREMNLREREVNLKQNTFWLNAMEFCLENDIDPGQILTYSALIRSLSAALVQDAAKEYLNPERYAQFELFPEHIDAGQQQ